MSEYCCAICGGHYENRKVTLELRTPTGDLIIVRDVPAEVCVQCGDELFTPEVTHQLMLLVQSPPAPVATLQVPVYVLAAA